MGTLLDELELLVLEVELVEEVELVLEVLEVELVVIELSTAAPTPRRALLASPMVLSAGAPPLSDGPESDASINELRLNEPVAAAAVPSVAAPRAAPATS